MEGGRVGWIVQDQEAREAVCAEAVSQEGSRWFQVNSNLLFRTYRTHLRGRISDVLLVFVCRCKFRDCRCEVMKAINLAKHIEKQHVDSRCGKCDESFVGSSKLARYAAVFAQAFLFM